MWTVKYRKSGSSYILSIRRDIMALIGITPGDMVGIIYNRQYDKLMIEATNVKDPVERFGKSLNDTAKKQTKFPIDTHQLELPEFRSIKKQTDRARADYKKGVKKRAANR